jgi:hypothetical protein
MAVNFDCKHIKLVLFSCMSCSNSKIQTELLELNIYEIPEKSEKKDMR